MRMPSTKVEAKALGLPRYFDGKSCSRGHVSERFSNGTCVECNRIHDQATKARKRLENPPRTPKITEHLSIEDKGERVKEYRRLYYAANKDALREANKEYRQTYGARLKAYRKNWYAENRDKALDLQREWREANREKLRLINRESGRKWYAKNKEKRLARGREHYRNNLDLYRVKLVRRRARKANAEGYFSKEDVERITRAQGGKCACCRRKAKLSIDHIIPLAKGGSNWPSNIQMLCLSCNKSKRDRDPLEFMQSRGALL